MVHFAIGTFFPKSRSTPHAITYNIISTGRGGGPSSVYPFAANHNQIAPLTPFYYRSAHVPTGTVHIQLLDGLRYATKNYDNGNNNNNALVALPYHGEPFGGVAVRAMTTNLIRGGPHLLAAPTPWIASVANRQQVPLLLSTGPPAATYF